MPSENPIFASGSFVKKLDATVINDIWPEVIFFSLIAAMVSLVSDLTSTKLRMPSGLLVVLGTVLGLVISFRTSTAYERYQEGRKLWTNITVASRSLGQIIWIHVPHEREAKPGKPETTVVQNMIEKKTMINLIQAFSVSLKHYLRAEPGIYYRDLYPLVSALPRHANSGPVPHANEELLPLWHASDSESEEDDSHFNAHTLHTPANHNPRDHGDSEKLLRTSSMPTPESHHTDVHTNRPEVGTSKSWFNSLNRNRNSEKLRHWDPESALANVPSARPLKPSRLPPKSSFYNYVPVLRVFRGLFRRAASRVNPDRRSMFGKKKPVLTDSNVPLEIILHLHAYFAWLMKNGLLTPAGAQGMLTQLATLQDTFSNLDRIMNTPLPFAYQVHLRMSLWIYLFFLPFQIWDQFQYLTIPATAFATFLFSGFLEIGQEIENPFNYDANDLDLDSFCLSIQRDLHEITAHVSTEPSQFVFSAWNQPFAPADRRTADQLCKDDTTLDHLPEDASRHPRRDTDDSQSSKDSIHLTLLRNWKEVDHITREKH